MVTWLKKYVDEDARHDPFLCPPPSTSDYSEWEDSYTLSLAWTRELPCRVSRLWAALNILWSIK
jgi:hypothetical protein